MHRRTFLQSLAALAAAGSAAPRRSDDLQALADAAAAEDREWVLPAGTFRVCRALRIGVRGVRGAGSDATTLVAAPGLEGPVLVAASGAAPVSALAVVGRVTTRAGEVGARFRALG